MPLVEATFLAGRVTSEHVEELASARDQSRSSAIAFARDEAALVGWATTLPFFKFVAEVKTWLYKVDPDGCERRAGKTREGRHVNLSQSYEDQWFLDGVLDPVGGQIVKSVLTSIENELSAQDDAAAGSRPDATGSPTPVRTRPQRRHDALVEMATRVRTAPADGRRPAPLFTVLVGEQ